MLTLNIPQIFMTPNIFYLKKETNKPKLYVTEDKVSIAEEKCIGDANKTW